jgi:hypothetical protein
MNPANRNLGEAELRQRVAVLKRLRELLLVQREKFKNYLFVLEREKDDIVSGNIETLTDHVAIENQVVSEILTFQKTIEPLELMCRGSFRSDEGTDILEIKSTLESLRTEVLRKNGENRALLSAKMGVLRQEIGNLRNPFRKSNPVYSSGAEPRLVDIRT